MDEGEQGRRRRRRGDLLEQVLLDAAWDELVENGYEAFTIDAVVSRAETSRPVLYRRWGSKQALVLAAIAHASAKVRLLIPDTGTLRDDIIALLQQLNQTRMQLATLIVLQLGSYYRETGTRPEDVRAALGADYPRAVGRIIARAVERGEIPPDLPRRVTDLPFDLVRQQIIMTSQPVPIADIEEIVDVVFLPLVRARTGAGGR